MLHYRMGGAGQMLADVTSKGLLVSLPIKGTGDTIWCSDFIASLIWFASAYPTKFAFRGHSDATFDFQSRLARVVLAENSASRYADLVARERAILADVREAGWLGTVRTPLARLASLQHRGVPTRLLDLTLDPLVATYFAAEKDSSLDGAVVLVRDPGSKVEMTNLGSLRFTPSGATYAVWPAPPIDDRIISQRGAFLVANNVVKKVQPNLTLAYGIAGFQSKGEWTGDSIQKAVDNYLNGQYRGRPKKYPPNLAVFLIPSIMKSALVKMLSRFGITKRSIYPDLQGYATSFLA